MVIWQHGGWQESAVAPGYLGFTHLVIAFPHHRYLGGAHSTVAPTSRRGNILVVQGEPEVYSRRPQGIRFFLKS